MSRPAKNETLSFDVLIASGENAPSIEEKLHFAEMIRATGDEAVSRRLDEFLIKELMKCRSGLMQAKEKQTELAAMMEKLMAFPWHTATFVSPVTTPEGERAIVLHGSSERVVGVNDGVALTELQAGDEVFLTHNLNLITAKSPRGRLRGGETAHFDRRLPNGQLVLKWRDEELIVNAAPDLAATELTKSDLVRFERSVWLAFEKVDQPRGQHHCILEEVPDIRREQIGGLDTHTETLFSALTIALADPAGAARYELTGRQSILMVGPPGCGKTLMARAAASEVSRVCGKRCRIAVLKPAELEGPYVGETQAAIRNFFKSLREAANEGFVVAFLDEIEAVGRIRGNAVGHHSDKFLAALLAELDGFTDRKNVAIIAATNRKGLVDSALLERVSDIEISVGRPNLRGARAIFGIHLPPTLPFSPNGTEAAATRQELIESGVSRIFSPNAVNNEISVIRFRDGKERTVVARELISGRIIEQVCRHARRAAFAREVRGEGDPGLRLSDMDDAVSGAMQRMRTSLSADNAHSYLTDLPQDVAIVSVQPINHRVQNACRYLNS